MRGDARHPLRGPFRPTPDTYGGDPARRPATRRVDHARLHVVWAGAKMDLGLHLSGHHAARLQRSVNGRVGISAAPHLQVPGDRFLAIAGKLIDDGTIGWLPAGLAICPPRQSEDRQGPYTLELRDGQGVVLASEAFKPMPSRTTMPMILSFSTS